MYTSNDFEDWYESNRNYFLAVINQLHTVIQSYINQLENNSKVKLTSPNQDIPELMKLEAVMLQPPALEQLCQRFELSEFERSILVFCAAIEIDLRFLELCVKAHNGNSQYHPTFGLALSALPNAHWSALAPDGALRYL